MSNLPFALLEHLASKAEQIRYIVGGTADEYLVPEDLLNDAWHFCERALQIEDALSERQKETVRALSRAIKEAPEDLVTRSAIVEDPVWAAIRERARLTLIAFGQSAPA